MATEVKLPEIAEGVDKGDVLTIFVKEGEEVDVDTPLLELESEKATVPIPSPLKGKVTKILVKQGQKITVGQALVQIDEGGAAAPAAAKPAEGAAPPAGDKPAAGAAPMDTKDIKRAEEKQSEDQASDPKHAKSGNGGKAAAQRQPQQQQQPTQVAQQQGTDRPIPAGPAVRRIARELGINLLEVNGSGRGGRITVEDLTPHIRKYISQNGGGAHTGGQEPVALPDFSKFGPIKRVKADSLRRLVANNVSQSWQYPHVHQFHEADVTELLALRKRHKLRVKALGGQLTLTPFILKAVAVALKEFPKLNCTYDPATNEFIFKEYFHIGIAVDTEAGLLVPVIRDVDKKTIVQISIELADKAERARTRKLSIDEMRGSSFSVSNLGSVNAGIFTPIVNSPETAILAISRAQKKPVWREKEGIFVPRDMMPICVAFDHRVIDGADGARFAARLGEVLENFEATFLGI